MRRIASLLRVARSPVEAAPAAALAALAVRAATPCAALALSAALTLALLVSAAAPALADDITLSLSPPELYACGWISVNGVVFSDRTVWDLVWDWGDGTTSVSWFPASHRYAADGAHTITVTAIGCTSEVEVTVASTSGAEGPGCPTDDAPPCHAARPCRYLHPYNMHLVDDANGPVPLHLRDAAGTSTPCCPSPQSSPGTLDGSRGSEWQANTRAERTPALVGDGHAWWLTAMAVVRLSARAHALHDETPAMDLSSGIVRPRGAKRSDGEARRGEAER